MIHRVATSVIVREGFGSPAPSSCVVGRIPRWRPIGADQDQTCGEPPNVAGIAHAGIERCTGKMQNANEQTNSRCDVWRPTLMCVPNRYPYAGPGLDESDGQWDESQHEQDSCRQNANEDRCRARTGQNGACSSYATHRTTLTFGRHAGRGVYAPRIHVRRSRSASAVDRTTRPPSAVQTAPVT